MDLVDRNLVIVAERRDLVDRNLLNVVETKFNGDFRFCKVNDPAWNLCVEEAKEESLRVFGEGMPSSYDPAEEVIPLEVITTYKPRRVFANREIYIESSAHPPTPSIRSLFCCHRKTTFIYDIAEYFRSFALLRVLNLPNCILIDFPPGIALLVHLRYLSIRHSFFPSPICNLRSLQTLIVTKTYSSMVLPSNISNLVHLKNLWSNTELYLPSIRKPTNLQTISNVILGDGIESFQKCFPIIKKLACTLYSDVENDFELLHDLETLKLTGMGSSRSESIEPEFLRGEPGYGKNRIRFPATLKKLTLVRCHLPWSDMSIIQSLPKLETLRLIDNAFDGTLWETGDEQFQQLKFLRLEELDIKQWEASSINFPCLKRLLVVNCNHLEEIPLEIGDISTLEFLGAIGCGDSLNISLGKMQKDQEDAGNYELKIIVCGWPIPSFVPKHDE